MLDWWERQAKALWGDLMLKKDLVLIICTFLLSGCLTNSQPTISRKGIINIPSTVTLKVNNKVVSIPLTDYQLIHNNGDGTSTITNANDSSKPSKFKTPEYLTFTKTSMVTINPIKNNPKIEVIDVKSNRVMLKNHLFKLPSKKGKYRYTVHVFWSNGKATYIFLAKVK